jgi:hypothetical protein
MAMRIMAVKLRICHSLLNTAYAVFIYLVKKIDLFCMSEYPDKFISNYFFVPESVGPGAKWPALLQCQ